MSGLFPPLNHTRAVCSMAAMGIRSIGSAVGIPLGGLRCFCMAVPVQVVLQVSGGSLIPAALISYR